MDNLNQEDGTHGSSSVTLQILAVEFHTDDRQPIVGVPLAIATIKWKDLVTHKESSFSNGDYKNSQVQFKFSWSISKEKNICCKHANRVGKIQCILCGNIYCGEECFIADWKEHNAMHFKHNQSSPTSFKFRYDPINIGRTYCPKEQDVGKILRVKCEPFDSEGVNRIGRSFILESEPIQTFPEQPPLRYFMRQLPPHRLPPNRFTVMSYNVLAEMYATKQAHTHLSSCYLDWNFRKQNLMREILSYQPDIICLQEVQNDQFDTFWKLELGAAGYDGLYKKKTKDIFTGKYTMDGCATFFKRDRFDLLEKKEIEFRNEAMKTFQVSRNQKLTRMIKDNVAIVVKLGLKGQYSNDVYQYNNIICVGNTHIMANPQYTDVKIWQVHTYLNELYKLTNQGQIPLVLAGDFNSLPTSGAYHLIIRGHIPRTHPDIHNSNNSVLNQKMHHSLQLQSAYGQYSNNQEPPFTTKVPKFDGTLDYIFYTNKLSRLSVLRLPEVEENGYLPNAQYSSDHLMLLSEFTWQ